MRIDKNLEIFCKGDVGMLRCVYPIAVTETTNFRTNFYGDTKTYLCSDDMSLITTFM